jgi:MFS transporter, PAT family, solute carrier family 33 (acetyl-CoA transportor), member 1
MEYLQAPPFVFISFASTMQLSSHSTFFSPSLRVVHVRTDIQVLLAVHFVAKIGFQANDAVTSLKMVEKGLGREDLAISVLIDFPFQMIGGWLAARWSTPQRPLRPWLWAYAPRLLFALIATLIVYYFPTPPISSTFFFFLVVHTVLQSFAS